MARSQAGVVQESLAMVRRVSVNPTVLQWARERAGVEIEVLERRIPKYRQWEAGQLQPTFKQLKTFAKTTYAPFGALFRSEPLVESLDVPDLRTVGDRPVRTPSPNLIDTVDLCRLRQDWYREFAVANGEEAVSLVGFTETGDDVVRAARRIRSVLGLGSCEHGPSKSRTEAEAARDLIRKAEEAGVLVMVSGIVGSNTRRKLDPKEFRGLALSDVMAPVVFVNGVDAKAAQVFTLAHELAHLALGQSALSNLGLTGTPSHHVEAWCNQVAAELLVPSSILQAVFRREKPLGQELNRLVRRFSVSSLVILRRLHDIGALDASEFREGFMRELSHARLPQGHDGGNFYASLTLRAGERFTRALIASTLDGKTLYRDALSLLGLRKVSTFHELARRMKVI